MPRFRNSPTSIEDIDRPMALTGFTLPSLAMITSFAISYPFFFE